MVSKTLTHPLIINDMHLDPQEILEIHEGSPVVAQGPVCLKTHDQIHVGGFSGIPPGCGTKDSDVIGAPFAGDFLNRLSFFQKNFARDHGNLSCEAARIKKVDNELFLIIS